MSAESGSDSGSGHTPNAVRDGSLDNDSDADGQAYMEAYWSANAKRFDLLSNSPSPKQQVLVGNIYIGDSEESADPLRPKGEDVVARAVRLAPDDAFVQWVAAEQGSYRSSQCGPTEFPEQEVANLVRLEPDNAAAWQFAVALASAIGDEDGVDDALSRMASASRADDHQIERIEEWTKAFLVQPEPGNPWTGEISVSADEAAFFSALRQASNRSNDAESVLTTVCSMRRDSDRVWQRLGWCADAATTLAAGGNSLDLRRQGLDLLKSMGVGGEVVASMRRRHEWLAANGSLPFSNPASPSYEGAKIMGDWRGAASEIEAIERRLRRLGLPTDPPAAWSVPAEPEEKDFEALSSSIGDYMGSLIGALRASDKPRDRAVAMVSGQVATMFSMGADSAAKENPTLDAGLAKLAAAQGDDVLVQWVAATATDRSASTEAISRLQRLEPDNAATWLALLANDPAALEEVLDGLAASRRYDAHGVDILRTWTDVAARTPPPAGLQEALASSGLEELGTPATLATAAAGVQAMETEARGLTALGRACTAAATASTASHGQPCIVAARLLLHSSTSMAAEMAAQQILHKLDGMSADDTARLRQVTWWARLVSSQVAEQNAVNTLVEDYLETGNEIEAMQRAARRAGKEIPPATWRAPGEPRAASATAGTTDE